MCSMIVFDFAYRQGNCRLSALLYAVEMTWRTIRKCNQFINVWPSSQMKNNIIFIISEQVRCTRSLANQTRLFVCLHHQWKSTCGLEEKKERDVQWPCGRVVKCKCISLYQLQYCNIACVLDYKPLLYRLKFDALILLLIIINLSFYNLKMFLKKNLNESKPSN